MVHPIDGWNLNNGGWMKEKKKKGSSYSRDKDYIQELLFTEPAARPKAEIEDVRAT